MSEHVACGERRPARVTETRAPLTDSSWVSCGSLLIIMAHKTTASHHARLHLCQLSSAIAKELDLMGISKYLSIFDTEEEALAEVRKSLA